jgi:hypothetical protein
MIHFIVKQCIFCAHIISASTLNLCSIYLANNSKLASAGGHREAKRVFDVVDSDNGAVAFFEVGFSGQPEFALCIVRGGHCHIGGAPVQRLVLAVWIVLERRPESVVARAFHYLRVQLFF